MNDLKSLKQDPISMVKYLIDTGISIKDFSKKSELTTSVIYKTIDKVKKLDKDLYSEYSKRKASNGGKFKPKNDAKVVISYILDNNISIDEACKKFDIKKRTLMNYANKIKSTEKELYFKFLEYKENGNNKQNINKIVPIEDEQNKNLKEDKIIEVSVKKSSNDLANKQKENESMEMEVKEEQQITEEHSNDEIILSMIKNNWSKQEAMKNLNLTNSRISNAITLVKRDNEPLYKRYKNKEGEFYINMLLEGFTIAEIAELAEIKEKAVNYYMNKVKDSNLDLYNKLCDLRSQN